MVSSRSNHLAAVFARPGRDAHTWGATYFTKGTPSLLRRCATRSVKPQESIQHSGKQKRAGSDELIFIKYERDIKTAAKSHSEVGFDATHRRFARDTGDSGDLLSKHGTAGEFVQPQDFLKCFVSLFHER